MSGAPADQLRIPTRGVCMLPWIWPGGELHVARCTLDELKRGDIAVWFDGASYRAHRVVRITERTVVTRGDLSLGEDAPVLEHQVVGRAALFVAGPVAYRLDRTWTRLVGVGLAPAGAFVADLRRGVGQAVKRARSAFVRPANWARSAAGGDGARRCKHGHRL
jgi:hypothetical protein